MHFQGEDLFDVDQWANEKVTDLYYEKDVCRYYEEDVKQQAEEILRETANRLDIRRLAVEISLEGENNVTKYSIDAEAPGLGQQLDLVKLEPEVKIHEEIDEKEYEEVMNWPQKKRVCKEPVKSRDRRFACGGKKRRLTQNEKVNLIFILKNFGGGEDFRLVKTGYHCMFSNKGRTALIYHQVTERENWKVNLTNKIAVISGSTGSTSQWIYG